MTIMLHKRRSASNVSLNNDDDDVCIEIQDFDLESKTASFLYLFM